MSTTSKYSYVEHKPPTLQQCDKWKKNPEINPLTNKSIKFEGPTYKWFQMHCCLKHIPVAPQSGKRQCYSTPIYFKPKIENRYMSLRNESKNSNLSETTILDTNIKNIGKLKVMSQHKKPHRGGSPAQHIVTNTSIKNPSLSQWYNNRIATGRDIKLGLQQITSKQWDMCMTGTKSQNFRKNFTNLKEIGKGTFGQIYKATLNNNDIVIKEAYLKPRDKRLLKTSSHETWEDIPKNTYPEEYSFMTFVNNILLQKHCPNFLYTYSMAMCDGCQVSSLFGTGSKGSCYVSFMELADGDLFDETNLFAEAQWSILYQILAAVYSIHHYYALFHRDIKTENIFLQKIKPGGYFKYVIGKDSYYIENTGYIAYLADFGVAEIFSPIHTKSKFYGERNAEVMESKKSIAGSNLYWDPIFSQKFAVYSNVYETPKKMNPAIIEWEDIEQNKMVLGTINNFGVLDIIPDRPVDLNDNRKFPCIDFYYDIQDVIRMFMGGKQTKQPSWHDGILNLDPDLRDILESEGFITDLEDTFYIHGSVKYTLAEEMLCQLYKYQPNKIDIKMEKLLDVFYL